LLLFIGVPSTLNTFHFCLFCFQIFQNSVHPSKCHLNLNSSR
jgi:hypothetical protein